MDVDRKEYLIDPELIRVRNLPVNFLVQEIFSGNGSGSVELQVLEGQRRHGVWEEVDRRAEDEKTKRDMDSDDVLAFKILTFLQLENGVRELNTSTISNELNNGRHITVVWSLQRSNKVVIGADKIVRLVPAK